MNELRGKVAFVTGATSSTGRAVALSLARRGADIAAFDRWENDGVAYTLKLDRLKQEVEQMGVRCLTLCGNSMKDVDVMVAVAETVVEFRRIDILS
jgi:NAD(P)-dependent dehydrogenase (short-subunit alcohol dehydrogenase family)